MTRDQFMQWLLAELEDPSKWEPGEPMVSDLEHTQTGRSLNIRSNTLFFNPAFSIDTTRKERKQLRKAIKRVQRHLEATKDYSRLTKHWTKSRPPASAPPPPKK